MPKVASLQGSQQARWANFKKIGPGSELRPIILVAHDLLLQQLSSRLATDSYDIFYALDCKARNLSVF